MRGISLKLIFLIVSFVAGCSVPRDPQSAIDELSTEAFSNPNELKQLLDNWKVECTDLQNCPESVGQVLITDGKSVGYCTGTLLDQNRVLTNSHCFHFRDGNRQWVSPQKLCESGTRIVFAAIAGKGHEQFRCKKILKKSEINAAGYSPDYLIFEVDNLSSRASELVSREGLSSREKYQIRKINPIRRGLGRLQVATCQVIHGTVLVPESRNPQHHVHVLSGCDMTQGNSGASVVDSEGRVRGVLFKAIAASQGSLNAFQRDILEKALRLKVGFVTNAGCIDFNFSQVQPATTKTCEMGNEKDFDATKALAPTEVKALFDSQKEFLLEGLTDSWSYGSQLKFVEDKRLHLWAPHCIKKPALSSHMESLTLYAATAVWFPEMIVRPDLTAYTRRFQRDLLFCSMSFSPAQFYRQGRGQVRLEGAGCVNSQGRLVESAIDTWSLCSEP